MTDEPGFLAHLYDNPNDDLARLVYADWLEEQGDARGAYLRLEVDLASRDEWSLDLWHREDELRRLAADIDPDWLELAGKRYDVFLVDVPANLAPLIRALSDIGVGIGQVIEMVSHQPLVVRENCLRARAEELRDRLLVACSVDEGGIPETPVQLRPTPKPRPRICRFPGPTDPPGYALRLVKRPLKGRGQALQAIGDILGTNASEATAVMESELPRTLRTYATPEEARQAARRFQKLHAVEVRLIEPPPRGRVLDRPLMATFAVVLHHYPERVKKQLIGVLRLMVNCSLPQARRLAASPLPMVLQTGLDWESAEALRQALPALAGVEIVEETD